MKIAGIQRQGDALLFLILPVEATVQHIQTEISVDNQIASRGHVGGEAEARCGLLPHQTSLIHILVIEQVLDVLIDIAQFEGLRRRHQSGPHLGSCCRLLFPFRVKLRIESGNPKQLDAIVTLAHPCW